MSFGNLLISCYQIALIHDFIFKFVISNVILNVVNRLILNVLFFEKNILDYAHASTCNNNCSGRRVDFKHSYSWW